MKPILNKKAKQQKKEMETFWKKQDLENKRFSILQKENASQRLKVIERKQQILLQKLDNLIADTEKDNETLNILNKNYQQRHTLRLADITNLLKNLIP